MSNRVAVVTGASRGIGKAVALALCKMGYGIVAASPSIETNAEMAEAIRGCSGTAMAVNLDLSRQESIKGSFDSILKAVGRVDILVNNAGITRDGLSMRMKAEDWDMVLRVNLTGAFHAAQAVLPGMLKERWGRIINISSVVGETGNAGQANYAASKAGLIGLTKSLAQEVASRNITVNAIAPGFIDTDMTSKLSDELKQRLLVNIPMKRFGNVDDVAAAVKFLASDEAGYITGQVIRVNGGMYM